MKDKGIHVIPTKWVDVNKSDDKRPEYGRVCVEKNSNAGTRRCHVEALGNWCDDSEGDIVKLKRPVRCRLICFLKDR